MNQTQSLGESLVLWGDLSTQTPQLAWPHNLTVQAELFLRVEGADWSKQGLSELPGTCSHCPEPILSVWSCSLEVQSSKQEKFKPMKKKITAFL